MKTSPWSKRSTTWTSAMWMLTIINLYHTVGILQIIIITAQRQYTYVLDAYWRKVRCHAHAPTLRATWASRSLEVMRASHGNWLTNSSLGARALQRVKGYSSQQDELWLWATDACIDTHMHMHKYLHKYNKAHSKSTNWKSRCVRCFLKISNSENTLMGLLALTAAGPLGVEVGPGHCSPRCTCGERGRSWAACTCWGNFDNYIQGSANAQ